MVKFLSRGVLVACLGVAAISCSNNSLVDNTGTTPTPSNKTDTFSDTLDKNGAKTHQFTATASGSVSAALTTLAGDPSLRVSLALGTWNGTVCQIILANDSAAQGTIVTGNVSTASNLCVRIADANGSVPGPTPYTITATHP